MDVIFQHQKKFKKEVEIDEKTVRNHFFNSFLCNTNVYVGRLPIGARKETG